QVSAYCSNIRQLTSRLRVLSVNQTAERAVLEPVQKDIGNESIALGGNKQFPFPGNVSSQIAYKNISAESENVGSMQPKKDVAEKQPVSELKAGDVGEKTIELKAVNCPDSMKKKVGELFPNQNVDTLSVLNVTQKTKNDMSAWNANMEIEWMAVSSGFVDSAIAACNALKSFGYWADFIDPSSGRPYLSKSNSDVTLNVTDDEYRSLGFDITDMGCCKILAHKIWGKMVFVGTIFTNAPVDSPAVNAILERVNGE
ncbi:Methylmalonic aciduria and homocystinuria type D -like protein, mitochondrial, partial [Toxocara canis]